MLISRILLVVVIGLALLVVAGIVFYGFAVFSHVQTHGSCTLVNGQPANPCSTPPPFP
jgi:hypothetical protein